MEDEKEFWRYVLSRMSEKAGDQNLRGSVARVRVRLSSGVTLPKTGSREREALEAIVRDAGMWEAMSHLSAPKINKAIGNGDIPPKLERELSRMCPKATRFQVTSEPLSAPTGGRLAAHVVGAA